MGCRGGASARAPCEAETFGGEPDATANLSAPVYNCDRFTAIPACLRGDNLRDMYGSELRIATLAFGGRCPRWARSVTVTVTVTGGHRDPQPSSEKIDPEREAQSRSRWRLRPSCLWLRSRLDPHGGNAWMRATWRLTPTGHEQQRSCAKGAH